MLSVTSVKSDKRPFFNVKKSVQEQIREQTSYTLHHIDRAKLFTENSAMARLRDILRG